MSDGIFCRKFDIADGCSPFLQQICLQSLVEEFLGSFHSSSTERHLGIAKNIQKIRQRFSCPSCQGDVKVFISRCPQCQKRSNSPKTHRHNLVDWKTSYPFHHLGIDFMGLIPESNGHNAIFSAGDFTKRYEAVPLQDQQASTTAIAPIEHSISRIGCPHSMHCDRGCNFKFRLFKNLLFLPEIDKSRMTAFHLGLMQSLAVWTVPSKTCLHSA